MPVILGEIRRLFRDGGALRVSRGLRDLSRKALEEADKLRQETGESPGVAQIAQRLGVPVEKAALALGVGLLLGLEPISLGVSVLMTGMPAGATAAIFAARYHSDAAFATRCVVLSTLLSMVTLPLWAHAVG